MTADDQRRPNVLFIVMDTARYTNVFSRDPVVMPKLQEITSEATSFANAFANAPWTVPSHGSMFTGQYPSDHGAHAGTKRFDPDSPVLAELFQEAGYRTAAFSNNTWLSPEFGFDRGFDSFFVRWELFEGGVDPSRIAKAGTLRRQLRAAVSVLASREAPLTLLNLLFAVYLQYQSSSYDSGARRTNERLIDWLETGGEQPFFAFVNYVEPHLRYEPPPEYRKEFLPDGMDPERLDTVNQDPWGYLAGEVEMEEDDFVALEALYNAELRYLDDRIYEVYERLTELGELDDTVLVIVGDHGENLGEHGMMDHQYCLYDTLLHVPLVMRYPSEFSSGTEVNELVELRDLFPTLLDVTGVEPTSDSESVSTRSLVNLASEETGRAQAFSEYLCPQPSMEALKTKVGGELSESVKRYDRALRSIRTPKWKCIEGSDGLLELYQVGSDNSEENEVSEEFPNVLNRLQKQLQTNLGSFDDSKGVESQDIEGMTKRRLEDLGYLQ